MSRNQSASPLSPLMVAACGAAAGLAGAVTMSALSRLEPQPKPHPKAKKHKPPVHPSDPFDPAAVQEWQNQNWTPVLLKEPAPPAALPAENPPGIDRLAGRLAEGLVAGYSPPPSSRVKYAAGAGFHLAYGALWGAFYGLAKESLPLPPLALGPSLGAALLAVGPVAAAPALGIAPPLHKQQGAHAGVLAATHLAYGLVTAAVYRAAARALSH